MLAICGTCRSTEERCPVCGCEVSQCGEEQGRQWFKCTNPECFLKFTEGTGGTVDHHICEECITQLRKDFGLDVWLAEQAQKKVLPFLPRQQVKV